MNLKGEVKTTPEKKNKHKSHFKRLQGEGEKNYKKVLFGVKSGSLAEVNAKDRCSVREVCASLPDSNVPFQNGVRGEKVNDS